MLHFVTTILILYSSFTHPTVLPALVPDKPRTAHTHTYTCVSDQPGRDKRRGSDTAECSWSAQASLELYNSQENSYIAHKSTMDFIFEVCIFMYYNEEQK